MRPRGSLCVKCSKEYGKLTVTNNSFDPNDEFDGQLKDLKELFQELGLGPTENIDETKLKQAFRRMAIKYHPDVNNATDASEKFARIKFAYETLKDPEKREEFIAKKTAIVRVEPTATRTTTTRDVRVDDVEFYSFEQFFMDLVKDSVRRQNLRGKSMSLWDELAAVGEELLSDVLDVLEEGIKYLDDEDEKSADEIIAEIEVDQAAKVKYLKEMADREAAKAKATAAAAAETVEDEVNKMLKELKDKMAGGKE
eukprot:CAMPEP_0167753598 /NCGR_PEP_ID=MMETSP0110_2-20121227/7805_1 /TAXON_ID=629695 /ORGANISM="Gymnochlora sp., Strain CCMP2014" /LENGTH=253 /DNA_ID=CAMNT_0007639387 /DNA_START=87 /DNA_END=848 /DNA_ORIENTATION=+